MMQINMIVIKTLLFYINMSDEQTIDNYQRVVDILYGIQMSTTTLS